MNQLHQSVTHSNAVTPVLLATFLSLGTLGLAWVVPIPDFPRLLITGAACGAVLTNSLSILYLAIRHPCLLCDFSAERSGPAELLLKRDDSDWRVCSARNQPGKEAT